MTISYCELTDGSDKIPDNLLVVLLRLRHACNPDFVQQYASVVRWYAEIDTSTRRVVREIGLDDSGHPIVFGPLGRNEGLWTGVSASIVIDGRDAPRIEKEAFEAAWKTLEDVYRNTVPPKRIEPRIPIRRQGQLIGTWSAALLHGPGGMSDQLISFLPDRRGFFEDVNGTLMYYDEFRWEIVGNGRITIRGVMRHSQDDASQIIESPSDFHYESVVVETQVHYSGSDRSIEVLYLPLRNERRAWVADAYGRCAIPLSENERPTFT